MLRLSAYLDWRGEYWSCSSPVQAGALIHPPDTRYILQ